MSAAPAGPAAPAASAAPAGAVRAGGYGRGARILSVGIATTGLVTFAYFSVARHALDDVPYSHISLLWSVMFVIVSVIYRPIEQLLSRTIAERRARGLEHGHPLRIPALIQLTFAAIFLAVALPLRGRLTDGVFGGAEALYWILVVGVIAYAASYFARGYLAGHQRFGLYGGLVFFESTSRFLFAVAAVAGLTHGQTAVGAGIAAAPFLSLVVVPWALGRRARAGSAAAAAAAAERPPDDGLSLRHGTGFALAVFAVMLSEQTLLNAAVLTVHATADAAALTGVVFNLLLISRAPLQLFQSIQTSLLPHLAGLEATEGGADFGRAIRITVAAIAGFAALVAVALLAVGPFAMHVLFPGYDYPRGGLALIAVGMGFHLVSGTLNQAALARGRAGLAGIAWSLSAALFVGWMLAPVVDDQLLRVELGYFGATLILAALLSAVYRRPRRHP